MYYQPDAGAEPLLDLIRGARKSVRLQSDLLNDKQIIDALVAAQARGVDVRVILEDRPNGWSIGNQPAREELGRANVVVKTGNPAFAQTHAGLMVIDDRVASIFTSSQTELAFSSYRSFVVIDPNPKEVVEIANAFDDDWNRTAPDPSSSNLVWAPGQSRTRLIELISSATRTLDVQAEKLNDDQVLMALANAVQRGVSVRLLMSPVKVGTDESQEARTTAVKAGIQLRFLKTPSIRGTMIISDQARGFVGSQDLTAVSLDTYRDLGIKIDDALIVRGMTLHFAADWDVSK